MKKTIWIINHYASHLESRHLELSKCFADRGYNAVVITSSFHHGKHQYIYDDDITIVDRYQNVQFVYLRSEPAYFSNGGKRVLNMLDFCRKVKKYSKKIRSIAGDPGYIIGSSAHPFVWETAYSLSKALDAKFVAEFRDIWPLSLVEVQGVSPEHPFVKLLSIIEKRAYRHADAIVATMPYAYIHVSEELGFPRQKVFWIPNGINTEHVDAVVERNDALPEELDDYLNTHWCCVYVGSIVKGECIDYLLDAWKLVRDPNLFFAIIGDGSVKAHIQQRIKDELIDNVQLFPPVKPDEVPLVLSKAKCCIAALEFGSIGKYGLSKYKLNDYLYSGKPTIFACDCRNIVEDAGHYSLPVGDPQTVADTIKEISALDDDALARLENDGKRYIKDTFDYKVIGDNYLSILEHL